MARYAQGGGMADAGRERREQVRMQATQWFPESRTNAWVAGCARLANTQ